MSAQILNAELVTGTTGPARARLSAVTRKAQVMGALLCAAVISMSAAACGSDKASGDLPLEDTLDSGMPSVDDEREPGADAGTDAETGTEVETESCARETKPVSRVPTLSALPQNVCTDAQIQALADCDLAGSCEDWLRDNSACSACVFTEQGAPAGPFYRKAGETSLTVNQEGCIDLKSKPGCGAAVYDEIDCTAQACGVCVTEAEDDACYEEIQQGDCKSIFDAKAFACKGSPLRGIASGCLARDASLAARRDSFVYLVSLFCANTATF